MGEFVDGLKFSGGSHSLMPTEFIREITELAHRHNIYVSTGDWSEHLLRKGPSSFKQYVEVCNFSNFIFYVLYFFPFKLNTLHLCFYRTAKI